MTFLKNFILFWWDFIVGDDWVIAAGVVIALAVSALLVRSGITTAWWIMPVAVVITLALSLDRERRKSH
jgi:hypothetical protein